MPLVTETMGVAAAFLAGRAVARSWAPLWHLAVYVLLLSLAVRLLRAGLETAPVLSLEGYVIDLVALAAAAWISHRIARASQIVAQYPWLFERRGPGNWGARESGTTAH